MKKNIIFFLLYLFFSNLNLYSVNYPGAGTDRGIGIYTKSLLLHSGDSVGLGGSTGLVWLAGGFTINDSGEGSIQIMTPFPVDNEIGLCEGTYPAIMRDMFLSNKITLTAGGTIAQYYGAFTLTGEFDLSNQRMTFIDNYAAKFSGNGNVLNFSNGGSLYHNAENILLENIYLKGIRNNSIKLIDRTKNLQLINCVVQLDGNFVADYDIDIYGDVLITGSGHTFCVNRQLAIYNGARLTFDYGTTFSMGYPADIDTWGTGIIHFKGCNIEIGDNYGQSGDVNNGFYLALGCVVFEDKVTINDDSNHKEFKIGSASDVLFLSGAQIHLDGTTTFSIL